MMQKNVKVESERLYNNILIKVHNQKTRKGFLHIFITQFGRVHCMMNHSRFTFLLCISLIHNKLWIWSNHLKEKHFPSPILLERSKWWLEALAKHVYFLKTKCWCQTRKKDFQKCKDLLNKSLDLRFQIFIRYLFIVYLNDDKIW